MKKRFMSMLLVLCMVFTLLPSVAFAEETGGATIGNTAIDTSSVTEGEALCENHKTHDKDCGYIEAKDGADCTHECELCIADDADKDVSPASLSATPRAADSSYSYDSDSKTLTIFSNTGTTAWRDNNNITKSDVTTVEIREGVTTIGNYAFSGCTKLASVDIPASVTHINTYAFEMCKFTSVTIPASVTTIGNFAFANCAALRNVTFAENSELDIIKYSAFESSGLTSLTIPDGVSEIYSNAFKSCTNLASVTFAGATPPTTFGEEVFNNTHADLKIYVPSASVDNYKAVVNLANYESNIEAKSDPITGTGYSYDPDSKALTIDSNEGTTAWRKNNNITKANVTTVEIKESVTSIDYTAFSACENLTSVTFAQDSQLAKIGDNAFSGCKKLANVIIPEGVTAIGINAFLNCTSLENVTISSGVTTIGNNAFYSCESLTSVTFESATPPTTFGTNVFTDTNIGLKIYVPTADAVTDYKAKTYLATWKNRIVVVGSSAIIGEGYSYDPDTTTLTIDSNAGTTAWRGNNNSITMKNNVTKVVIELGVTTIGNKAFENCEILADVTIPESVTNVGNSAFKDCESLASVTIPSGVTAIGDAAFSGCTKLDSVTFADGSQLATIGKDAFEFCNNLASVTIPSRVTTIGEYAFYSCGKLTSVTFAEDSKLTTIDEHAFYNCGKLASIIIPEGVTTIMVSTFSSCTNLASVTIPISVTTIGEYAFNGCRNLTSVTIPSDVTTIEKGAFYGCSSLANMSIPSDVTTIGDKAFKECSILADVTFEGATPPTTFGTEVFKDTPNNLKIYVPTADAVTTYKAVPNLSAWKNRIVVVGSNAIMGEGFSYDTTTLTIFSSEGTTEWKNNNISPPDVTKVVIESGVTKIGDNAFYGCNNLANVTIPSSVTSIGIGAFGGGCASLVNVTIPSSVTSIGNRAFQQCTKLTSVTFERVIPPSFGTEVFTSTPDTLKIYVPSADAVEAYKAVPNLSTWKNNIARTEKKWDIRVITVGTMLSPGDLLDLDICPRFISIDFMDGLSNYGQTWSAFVNGAYTPLYTYEKALEDGVTTPIPEGTRFICWKVTKMEGRCTESLCPLNGTEHGAEVIDLEAAYEPISVGSHTVTLNANGGSVSPTSLTVTAGNTATLPTPSRSGSYRFDGWFTAASGGTQYTNSTPIDRSVTLYAHWTYTGGGSTGGDGGSSNIIVTPPAPDKPNTPTQAEIKVDGKTDANGNTTITVTDGNINDAIAKAEAEAQKNGNTANGVTIVLSATGGKNATKVTVNLPKTVQDTIISKKVVSTIIVVDNPDVQIGMDLKAVTEINAQAKSDVNITATRIDSSKLTGTAQTAIGSRPVFDLAVNYGSDKQVQSFGAGGVSVTFPYTLGANEKAENVCAVYVDGSGKVQWLTSSVYDSTAKVLRFSTNHFSTYGVGYKQSAPAFTDIANHWAKADIEYVVSRRLFAGTSATTFSPNTAQTRGMFVTVLGRLANADVRDYKTSSFSDVKADAYYMGYIEWANKNGIANGSNGKFMPDQSITREQIAVIMQNYAKVIGFTLPMVHEEKAFADSAKISGYAKDAVKTMQMAGVLIGKSGNVFDPQGTASRAEVSAVLRRFVELRIGIDTAQGWTMNDSGKWMYYEGGKPVIGKKDIDGVSYTFDQNGETADVPKNLSYTTHTVVKNESWVLIAQEYGCSAEELARVNNKTVFDVIHPGDVLKVPQK